LAKLASWFCGSLGEGMTTISIFFKCSSNKSLRVEQWGFLGSLRGGKIVGVDGNGCHGGKFNKTPSAGSSFLSAIFAFLASA